jgi:GTP-binding protein
MLIQSAKYIVSSPDFSKCPAPDKKEYAFIGRSNVGKSSLINMLTNKDKLAKTSATPGKTQLINHFEVSSISGINKDKRPVSWYLVDLPGYGFAKVSLSSRRRWEQMIEGYLRKRENLEMVFVLLDARLKPQQIDLDFLSRLDKWQVPFAMIFTKADKETQAVVAKNVRLFLDRLRESWQYLPQHFVSSATKKLGKDKILHLIDEKNETAAAP